MSRKLSLLLTTAVVVFDVLTKRWAVAVLRPVTNIELIPGFLDLNYAENSGIAFGLFDRSESAFKPLLLMALAGIAVLVVLFSISRTPRDHRLLHVALAILLGGIIGNFIDRVTAGTVVDFVDLHWRDAYHWPTFNLADAAITCSVLVIVFDTLFGTRNPAATKATTLPRS